VALRRSRRRRGPWCVGTLRKRRVGRRRGVCGEERGGRRAILSKKSGLGSRFYRGGIVDSRVASWLKAILVLASITYSGTINIPYGLKSRRVPLACPVNDSVDTRRGSAIVGYKIPIDKLVDLPFQGHREYKTRKQDGAGRRTQMEMHVRSLVPVGSRVALPMCVIPDETLFLPQKEKGCAF